MDHRTRFFILTFFSIPPTPPDLLTLLLQIYNLERTSFAVKCDRTMKSKFKKLAFEEGKVNWIDEKPRLVELQDDTVHYSTLRTPVLDSLKEKQIEVFENMKDTPSVFNTI